MKTVVITGSSRGLGFEMAKQFRSHGWNVVLNGVNPVRLEDSAKKLLELPGEGAVEYCSGNVSSSGDLQKLLDHAMEKCGGIDIWINNAGVNQPMKAIWELTEAEIDHILNVDLKGAIMGSKLALIAMAKQGHGAIYNIEGYGSNDAMMLGLNMYGTSKRAITHFTQALAKESEEMKTGVIVGRLSPGIMITDFITGSLGGQGNIDLPEKTRKFYNMVGDYPDVIAEFLVKNMVSNEKNNVQFNWLTGGKVMWRIMTAGITKRKLF